MANLQVKNVPDALYDAMKARALEERTTISELVLRTMTTELERPSLRRWVSEQRTLDVARDRRPDVDVQGLMDDVRGEFDR